MDDESDWQRQVLIGLIVLVTVGAVVGGLVAVVTIKAADLAGIDETTANTGLHRPRVGGGGPANSGSSSAPTESTPPPAGGGRSVGPTAPTRGGSPADAGITLIASPRAVSTYERINLTGSYVAADGTVLQVQRKEGGRWVDFPAVATVRDGAFSTYIETGHTGVNMLRVLAVGRAEVSNIVRVQVS